MATFKAVTRSKRSDGTYLVYIRCTHNRKIDYIKTDYYIVADKYVDGEITDKIVSGNCTIKIRDYMVKLNFEDITNWTVKEVVDFLTCESDTIKFIPYCIKFIDQLVNEGRGKSASNYKCAVKSFELYFGNQISFQEINTKGLENWIKSLSGTARAKQAYPKSIKTIFDAGCLEYNDYNRNIIKIPNRPFIALKIPKAEQPEKRAIEASAIVKLMNVSPTTKRSELAQDVAKLMIYLVGINTVDLYYLTHDNLKNGKLCYNRRKTMNGRPDKAYIEVKVKSEIDYLFEKWQGRGKNLFDWGYKNEADFNKYVNIGLKKLCADIKIPNVDSYTFRHSWATIAINDCDISLSDVAFCLNHSTEHKVTERYVKKKFDKIDIINNKVIDFIFRPKKKK